MSTPPTPTKEATPMDKSARGQRPIALINNRSAHQGANEDLIPLVSDWLEGIGHQVNPNNVEAITVWTPYEIDVTTFNVNENGEKYRQWHSIPATAATSTAMVTLADPVPGWLLEAFDASTIFIDGTRVDRAV